jgi:hypothetical protein
VVWDTDTGDAVQVLDEAERCVEYSGSEYYGLCGGCDRCLLMQAEHYGFEVQRVELAGSKTVDEAVDHMRRRRALEGPTEQSDGR